MGRMSALHNPAAGLTEGSSVPPASRNGGSDNSDVNGATIDLTGRRGVHFTLHLGITTGAANVAARIQTNDLPSDPANGNWSNVNYTTYANAQITAQTNDNTAYGMDYVTYAGGPYVVRAVLVPDANVSLAGVSHVTY